MLEEQGQLHDLPLVNWFNVLFVLSYLFFPLCAQKNVSDTPFYVWDLKI